MFVFKKGKMDGKKERKQEGGKEAAHLLNSDTMQNIMLQTSCNDSFGQEFVSGSMEPAVLTEQFIAVQTEDICGK